MAEKNGRVTLAILKTDISYLSKYHNELKTDVKEIKEILMQGSSKIAKNRQSIAEIVASRKTAHRIYGAVLTALGLFLAFLSYVTMR
jgi:uncharacterized protein YydD (DUF2326 family)